MSPLVADSPPRAVRRAAPAALKRTDRPPAAAPLDRDTRMKPSAGRVVLGGANWAVYRALREDPRNDRFKLTYDGPTGRLEIEMSKGPLHESVSCLLAYFVMAFRLAGGPKFRALGAVTLNREDLDRGLDSDESFYIANLDRAPELRANALDLNGGAPPPDLAVEVDVTSPGVSKLPIYAALGVPEVWVWDAADDSLTARRLNDGGGYEVVTASVELPGFPLAVAAELIRDRGGRDDGELQAAFAERLRSAG